jgi:hypothetical protein
VLEFPGIFFEIKNIPLFFIARGFGIISNTVGLSWFDEC